MPSQHKPYAAPAYLAAFGLLLQLAMAASGYSQQCGSCQECSGASGCPSPTPVLEIEPGWSLYWHDACRCSEGTCVPATCATSGAPVWYVVGEMLPLFRDQLDGDDFQADSLAPGIPAFSPVLTESDLKPEFDWGGRVLVGRTLGDWYRLEGSYFGSYGWDDWAAVWNDDANDQGGNGNLSSPFGNFGIPTDIVGLDYNQFASVRFSSELDNVELNLRRRVCIPALNCGADCGIQGNAKCCFGGTPISRRIRAETSFLIGVRYMRLEETFGYETVSTAPAGGSNNIINLATDNEMIGAQVGWTLQLLVHKRRWFDVEMKGGIFQNNISLTSSYVRTNNAGAVDESNLGGDSKDRTAYVTELSVIYNHQITPRITFRAGYNAFWVWQVALASQNLGNSIDRLRNATVPVRHDGEVVYHGPSLGLVWAW